jgi:hypothetical protein
MFYNNKVTNEKWPLGENMGEKPPLTVRFRVQGGNLMIRGNKLPGGSDCCRVSARRPKT